MNNKSRRVLRLVAGLYLIYLSFNLISQQLKNPTSNAVVAWIGGILFAIVGVCIVVNYARTSMKEYQEQENEVEVEEVEEIEEKIDEE